MKKSIINIIASMLFCSANICAEPAPGAKSQAEAGDSVKGIVFAARTGASDHLFERHFYPGGNLFVLSPPEADGKIVNLTNLSEGDVADPDVSYDGGRILFSMKRSARDHWHIYEISADGTGLRQLTSGEFDGIHPCYLPDDQIVFCSTRPGFMNECGEEMAAVLHVMDNNGGNIRQISYNLSSDATPAVLDDGRIVYTRWENHGQMNKAPIFVVNPDGSEAFIFYGAHDGANFFEAQPLPDGRIICTLSKIKSRFQSGAVGIIDRGYGLRDVAGNITPNVNTGAYAPDRIGDKYRSPYPLPDGRIVVSYTPRGKWDFGIYTMALSGLNRRLLYNDSNTHEFDPLPLLARKKPPKIARKRDVSGDYGALINLNVYDLEKRGSHGASVPKRGGVKSVRVIEGLPRYSVGASRKDKSRTPISKRIIGVAPVYGDGSFHIRLPARTRVHFQILDARSMALVTSLSWTYVMPGESRTCIGCHESRTKPPRNSPPTALSHPPTKIGAIWDKRAGSITFARDIKPILDEKCVTCHSTSGEKEGKPPAGGLDLSGADLSMFQALLRSPIYGSGEIAAARESYLIWKLFGEKLEAHVPRDFVGSKMPPPSSGAQLTQEEIRKFIEWIDLGSVDGRLQ